VRNNVDTLVIFLPSTLAINYPEYPGQCIKKRRDLYAGFIAMPQCQNSPQNRLKRTNGFKIKKLQFYSYLIYLILTFFGRMMSLMHVNVLKSA
jgi:hypothetical protein